MMSFISDTAITAICASIPATLLALAALWKTIKIEHALNGKAARASETETPEATAASKTEQETTKEIL